MTAPSSVVREPPWAARSTGRGLALRLVLLALDVAAFDLVFYLVLRSVLLEPLGFVSLAGTVGWVAAFAGLLVLLARLRLWDSRFPRLGLGMQFLMFGSFCAVVAVAAGTKIESKGLDYSWLRVEVVKVPYWFAMFVRTNPGFSAALGVAVGGLALASFRAPRSRLLRLAPGVAVVALAVEVVRVFGPIEGGPSGPMLTPKVLWYVVAFSGPMLVFWVLFALRAYVSAFRAAPFVIHTLLIALNYMGCLPISRRSPEFRAGGEVSAGVTRLYPTGSAEAPTPFRFLRELAVSPDWTYVTYGPTCGIYSIQRETGALRTLEIPGLMRDLDWSLDRRRLWATNWMTGDFIVVDPETLRPVCTADLFGVGLPTPWGFVADRASGLVYMSNVTPPVLAELAVDTRGDSCGISVRRQLDFHKLGYTRFTDGAYGVYVDGAHDRVYVLVAMLNGRYEAGLVEVDLKTFRMTRDIKLPSGVAIVPVRGHDTVLLPPYYGNKIFEVSLSTMRVVRTIDAPPTITTMVEDPRRGLFYATSRTTGELLVIDYKAGEIVRRYNVGVKPEALQLDPARDELFVGSGAGLFRISLPKFLKGLGD